MNVRSFEQEADGNCAGDRNRRIETAAPSKRSDKMDIHRCHKCELGGFFQTRTQMNWMEGLPPGHSQVYL